MKKAEKGNRPENAVLQLTSEQEMIEEWIHTVRFKKKSFGGVDELDVWKKIGELNDLYGAAIAAERARYDVLLEEICRHYQTGSEQTSLGEQQNECTEAVRP